MYDFYRRWKRPRADGAQMQEVPVTTTVIDPSTGHRVTRTFRRGRLHSFNDEPAVMEHDPQSGALLREQYFADGLLHRAGSKPAYIEYSPRTGLKTFEVYCREGKIDGGTSGIYAVDYDAVTGESLVYDRRRPGAPPVKDSKR